MATSSTFCGYSSLLVNILLFLLQYYQLGTATPGSFCPQTLSRPSCPDLPTYDKFDITTYGGRWFEIGASANFKNVQESGGICVLANYSLLQPPSPGEGAVVGVVNTLYSLGAPLHNVSQVVVSLNAGQVCAQAFSICVQVDQTNANSSLAQGFALVSNVSLAIKDGDLIAAMCGIEASIIEINTNLDILSNAIKTIQVLDAQLGQGQGDAIANVATLMAVIEELNDTTKAIGKVVTSIDKGKEVVEKVAAQLASNGDVTNSVILYKATGLLGAGEGAIMVELEQIQSSLASMLGVAGLFLTPSFGEIGYDGRIVGTALQNASFAGKLEVTFPSFPPGAYWVLAVDSVGVDVGYAATLVYGCDQNQVGGGIEQTLFILSRTPTLPATMVHRLLAKAKALGVSSDCSTPFIFTVQSSRCGNPPSDFLP